MHVLGASHQHHAEHDREHRDVLDPEERIEVDQSHHPLPRDITREKLSVLGWSEECLHHTRSYCAMYGGDGGESARQDDR